MARLFDPDTVQNMENETPVTPSQPPMVFVSGELSDGVFVTTRVASGLSVYVRFHDDSTLRDVTEWIADLVAVGLVAESRRANGIDGAPEEVVTVAEVEIHPYPRTTPGTVVPFDRTPVLADSSMIEAWVVTPSNRLVVAVPLNDLLTAAADGIAAMLLDGVAQEAADVEADPSSISVDPVTGVTSVATDAPTEN